MSFQKILDFNRNANINNGKTVEHKLDIKKLTKRDEVSKSDIVNILEKGNTDGEETDEEDGKLL